MGEDFAALLSGRRESLCTMRVLFKSANTLPKKIIMGSIELKRGRF